MKKLSFLIVLIGISTISSCKKEPLIELEPEMSIHRTSFLSGKELLASLAPEPVTYQVSDGNFESNSGVRYSIMPSEENLEVELTEYWTPKEMFLANLFTESDGEPIVSEGSFKMNVYKDGETFLPSFISTIVPDDSYSWNMRLFNVNQESPDTWTVIPISAMAGSSINYSQNLGYPDTAYAGYYANLYLNEGYFLENGTLVINYDHFLNENIPLTDILVRPSASLEFDPLNMSGGLIFTSQNMTMPGIWSGDNAGIYFQNLPIGFNVDCLVISIGLNGELLVGHMNFNIEENGVYSLEMENISEEELAVLINGL